MKNWYDLMMAVRDEVSDNEIVDEMIQYFNSDQIKDFANHMIDSYDLEIPDDEYNEDGDDEDDEYNF